MAFQSTRPVRGATRRAMYGMRSWLFQSTRPVRGATISGALDLGGDAVSIHAPRAGRDLPCVVSYLRTGCFNPRAPCGARRRAFRRLSAFLLFQSTRPVRGATRVPSASSLARRVSIHAPRAGRDVDSDAADHRAAVSIHAPRAGRDPRLYHVPLPRRVSIHAPRAGRDPLSKDAHPTPVCFNPRAPCGARPRPTGCGNFFVSFNPRAPCGARLQRPPEHVTDRRFNPRAPCGARPCTRERSHDLRCFNPRAPCGARPLLHLASTPIICFNPRAPCGARPSPPMHL